MLPGDAYLRALGKAAYCIAYTEWLVIEVVQRLDPSIDVAWSAPRTMGTIAKRFVTAVELAEIEPETKTQLSDIAAWVKRLVSPRNDVAHARRAMDDAGRQRLFHWAPGVDIGFITDGCWAILPIVPSPLPDVCRPCVIICHSSDPTVASRAA